MSTQETPAGAGPGQGQRTGAGPHTSYPGVRTPPPQSRGYPPRGGSGLRTCGLVVGGCLMLVGAVTLLFGFFILLGLSRIADTAEQTFSFQAGGHPTEAVIPGDPSQTVAVVNLTGPIMGTGTFAQGEGPAVEVAKTLRAAAKDDRVKAVILQVQSGGGALTASDLLYHEVKRLQDAGKPVVALVTSMAASGAYYVIADCDHIVLTPTGMVGSFGVIMPRFMAKELLDKIGIKYDPIESTPLKDLGSMFRELSEEERAYLNDLLETWHTRFVQLIAQGRELDEGRVRELANGKMYTPAQALEYGLVDQEGYFEDALQQAETLAGLTDPHVVRYKKAFPWRALLQAGAAPSAREIVREGMRALEEESALPRPEAR